MTRQKKIRLDDLIVERNLAPNRAQAQALLLAGRVLLGDSPAGRPGDLVPADSPVRLRRGEGPYLSRGGVKLKGALEALGLSVAGLVALDVGASTGGFTDCLLKEGARKVYALDVAYGQLAWRLRNDPRVVVLERTNIRTYDGRHITEEVDLALIDTSFISLKKVIPAAAKLIRKGGRILALVKPQFEVRRQEVESGGVVRDPKLHGEVLSDIASFCQKEGLLLLGECESPIRGPAGNREFFLLLEKQGEGKWG